MIQQAEHTFEVNLRIVVSVTDDMTPEQVAKAVEAACTGDKSFAQSMWDLGAYEDHYVTTVDQVVMVTSKATVYRGE